MKIFLCWSGKASLEIARALYEWLGDTVQELKPFMSTEDIRKGDRWRNEIGARLSDTNFGILCLTPENLESRWILFEAGALSKHVEHGRVTAVLHKVKATDITEPLSQFQHTQLEKEDLRRLLIDMNAMLGPEKQLTSDRLNRLFDSHWPTLEARLTAISDIKADKPSAPTRGVSEMVQELLDLARSQSRQIQQLADVSVGESLATRLGINIGDVVRHPYAAYETTPFSVPGKSLGEHLNSLSPKDKQEFLLERAKVNALRRAKLRRERGNSLFESTPKEQGQED